MRFGDTEISIAAFIRFPSITLPYIDDKACLTQMFPLFIRQQVSMSQIKT